MHKAFIFKSRTRKYLCSLLKAAHPAMTRSQDVVDDNPYFLCEEVPLGGSCDLASPHRLLISVPYPIPSHSHLSHICLGGHYAPRGTSPGRPQEDLPQHVLRLGVHVAVSCVSSLSLVVACCVAAALREAASQRSKRRTSPRRATLSTSPIHRSRTAYGA